MNEDTENRRESRHTRLTDLWQRLAHCEHAHNPREVDAIRRCAARELERSIEERIQSPGGAALAALTDDLPFTGWR